MDIYVGMVEYEKKVIIDKQLNKIYFQCIT